MVGQVWGLSQAAGGSSQCRSSPKGSGQRYPPMRSPPFGPQLRQHPGETLDISPSGFPLPDIYFQPLGKERRQGPVLGPNPDTRLESPEGTTRSRTESRVGVQASPQPQSPLTHPPPLPRTRRVPTRIPRRMAGSTDPATVLGDTAETSAAEDGSGINPKRWQGPPASKRSPRPAAPSLGALPGGGPLRAPQAARGRE